MGLPVVRRRVAGQLEDLGGEVLRGHVDRGAGADTLGVVALPALKHLSGIEMPEPRLLGAGVLGDGLGPLGHGVLGQLAGQQEAHRRLDLRPSTLL